MNSDFRELLTILNACQVEYLVVGGYAFIHYAEPRYTKDIDLWILPSEANAVRLREALMRFGGWVEGMSLDHFAAAHRDRVMSDIGSVSVPFISLDHLIQAKRAAGRPQDLLDVAALEQIAKDGQQP